MYSFQISVALRYCHNKDEHASISINMGQNTHSLDQIIETPFASFVFE